MPRAASNVVALQVKGTHKHVMSVLNRLKTQLGDDGTVWTDDRDDPFPGAGPAFDKYSGEVLVEFVHEASFAGAVGHLNGIVNAVDPEHEVIVGGDFFKRSL